MARSNARRRAARLVRRMPGYRYARRSVLPRVRANDAARGLIKRIFAVDGAQHAPLDVAAGNLLGGVGTERLPVVVVILIGVPADRVPPIVDEIAQLQVLSAAFRPVVVMDVPQLAATRRYGYVAELLVDEASWNAADGPWDHYVSARLASIVATYRSSATITVGPDGPTHLDRVLLAGADR